MFMFWFSHFSLYRIRVAGAEFLDMHRSGENVPTDRLPLREYKSDFRSTLFCSEITRLVIQSYCVTETIFVPSHTYRRIRLEQNSATRSLAKLSMVPQTTKVLHLV